MFIVLARSSAGRLTASELDDTAELLTEHDLSFSELPAFVAERERERPRWVWSSTALWYPQLLEAGLRVERCVDLALCNAILRMSVLTAASEIARSPRESWTLTVPAEAVAEPEEDTLFDFVDEKPAQDDLLDAVAEFRRQQDAVAASAEPGRIRLLLAAESAGGLLAAEMRFAGLPWSVDVQDRLLTDLLGPRVPHGSRPQQMEALAGRIRQLLDAPQLNPDSQADLLRALRRAGLNVSSTRKWELQEIEHPVIEPLLEYKKLSRLLVANGWTWMDSWIVDGRFHPDYIPGGVVTGRWATNGGGALQLPKQIRSAVVADPGWKLVVADAAQLEPRVLAGLAGDRAMADAGRGNDFYDGIVASGAVDTRAHAKIAMLGAMYGATTGDSARLMPRLTRTFPKAIGLVENAARAGERGEIVTSRLGRSSPKPSEEWSKTQLRAYDPDATAVDERRARSRARDWGRFTRNFVVQASAAEWALCWMAELRRRLAVLETQTAGKAPGVFARHPHLVFFLHDEVVVHAPAELADRVAEEIRESAAQAGQLLFGSFPVDFPLTVAIVDDYAKAK